MICGRFPKDKKTWTIERQFMWGDGLLISPVLTAGDDTVNAYLPQYERWYDLHKVSDYYSNQLPLVMHQY